MKCPNTRLETTSSTYKPDIKFSFLPNNLNSNKKNVTEFQSLRKDFDRIDSKVGVGGCMEIELKSGEIVFYIKCAFV